MPLPLWNIVIMSLHRYHTSRLLEDMQGGSLIRYKTPILTQRGSGLGENLLKIVGPPVVTALQSTLQDVKQGRSLADSVSKSGPALRRNLKRKAPAIALAVGKHKATQRYKKAKRRVSDIFG